MASSEGGEPVLNAQQLADLNVALARQKRLGRVSTDNNTSVAGEAEAASNGSMGKAQQDINDQMVVDRTLRQASFTPSANLQSDLAKMGSADKDFVNSLTEKKTTVAAPRKKLFGIF